MHNNITAAGSRDRPPIPNGDALRKCILKGPYTSTIVTTPAVPTTEDSPAVPDVKSVKKENTHRQVEYSRKSKSPRDNKRNWNGIMTQKLGNGFKFIKKACFVCGSFNHLIKYYDFHDKKMVEKPVLNNKGRVTGQREIRPVWNNAQRGNPQYTLQDQEIFDSGCSRHMTGNKSFLTDYQEMDGGFVAFGEKSQDETPEILKNFITGIENQIDHKVKTIRCDNGTEFKNRIMNELCEMKGIRREFSVARTPQQNGRKHALSFMRPFGCPVTILNTLDLLGKFDGKSDDGFFIGYSINSKALRVFNTRTRFVEKNLHINFLENKPNVAGTGPNWMFDIDTLTMSMNYQLVFTGNQTNGNAGTKANIDAGQAGKKTVSGPQYVLLPFLSSDTQGPKSSNDEVTDDAGKKNEAQDPAKEDKDTNGNNTYMMFTPVNAAGSSYENLGGSIPVNAITFPNDDFPTDPLMPDLKDTTDLQVTGIFSGAYDDEDVGAEADLNNLETTMSVSPIPTTRIHKDHPKEQIIGDINSATQTRRMIKMSEEHAMIRRGHWNLSGCIENKKAERGILVRNKARLVAQGYTQEEGIDYNEVFAHVARIEVIRFDAQEVSNEFYGGAHFLLRVAVKTASTLIETNKALLKDEEAKDVDVHLYRSMIGSLMYLTTSRPDIMFAVCACARFQVTPKTSHLHALKRIIRYIKGQSKLYLWYPRDSPFDLKAFSDSDYAGASLDRKSTTGGVMDPKSNA
ncbi:ribonuclease H-like domain-containing protein [Tanacetum coccineum]